jgi:hypothetical protein
VRSLSNTKEKQVQKPAAGPSTKVHPTPATLPTEPT